MRRSAFLVGAISCGCPAVALAQNKHHGIVRIPQCTFPGDNDAFKSFSKWDGFNEPFDGKTLDVYVAGSGPPVIVLHEINGATPQLFTFAKRISEHFRVYVPILFGRPNATTDPLSSVIQICIRREFALFSTAQSSPIIQWVRHLGRRVNADSGGRGIGVIGLCLTGNFALAMMADSYVLAPVASEPALPFLHRASLGLSKTEISALIDRLKGGTQIAVFRFRDDPYVPDERIRALENLAKQTGSVLAGDARIEPVCENAHAVFTAQFQKGNPVSEGAFAKLSQFLEKRLS